MKTLDRHSFLAELYDDTGPVALLRVAAGEPRWSHRDVGFDSEQAFSKSKEDFSRALVRVQCPSCNRTCAPLLALRSTRYIRSGWEWVGIEYQQPYTDYLCRCRCGHRFQLHVYSSQ